MTPTKNPEPAANETQVRGKDNQAFAKSPLDKIDCKREPQRRKATLAMMIACGHADSRTNGKDRHGNQRFRCKLCGKTWVEAKPVKPLGDMSVPVADAKLVLEPAHRRHRRSVRQSE